jgi:hypothetical protein
MPLMARVSVIPLHGQVVLTDSEARDYPQWQTGQEKAVALPNSVAVATRTEREGDVTIEVWDDKPGGEEELDVAYEGELRLTGDSVDIGNVEANDLHRIRLGNGHFHLRVLTASSATPPDRVYFVVTRLT